MIVTAHRKVVAECMDAGMDFTTTQDNILLVSGSSSRNRIYMPAISRYRDAILSDLQRANYIAENLFTKLGVSLAHERKHP